MSGGDIYIRKGNRRGQEATSYSIPVTIFLLRIPPFLPQNCLSISAWILTWKPSYDISAFTLENVMETTGKIFASFCFVFFQYFSFIIGSVRITNEFGYFVYFSFLTMTQDGPYRSSPCEGSDQKKKNKKNRRSRNLCTGNAELPGAAGAIVFWFLFVVPLPRLPLNGPFRWLVRAYFFIYFFVFLWVVNFTCTGQTTSCTKSWHVFWYYSQLTRRLSALD